MPTYGSCGSHNGDGVGAAMFNEECHDQTMAKEEYFWYDHLHNLSQSSYLFDRYLGNLELVIAGSR